MFRQCPIEMKSVSVAMKTFRPKHGTTKLLFSILRITFAVVLVKALFFVSLFWLMHLEMEAENVAGPAPDGDYSVRRKWGEQHLEAYLVSAENWIRKSQKIKNAIGNVDGIAPIKGPNKHGCSFGESWTTLNLQVIGPKGEGILTISEDNWGGLSGHADLQEEHWSYKRASH